jgi:hypothetical protein
MENHSRVDECGGGRIRTYESFGLGRVLARDQIVHCLILTGEREP